MGIIWVCAVVNTQFLSLKKSVKVKTENHEVVINLPISSHLYFTPLSFTLEFVRNLFKIYISLFAVSTP